MFFKIINEFVYIFLDIDSFNKYIEIFNEKCVMYNFFMIFM